MPEPTQELALEEPRRNAKNHPLPESAERITRGLVRHLEAICDACGATAVLVYADALRGEALPLPPDGLTRRILYVTRSPTEQQAQEAKQHVALRVPAVPLTRMGQVKIALLLALSRGLVRRGDVLVCLVGTADSGALDTLVVTEVGRELEMYASADGGVELLGDARPEVLERVIEIASELGRQGREGRPVGVLFVVGDTDRVLSLSRPLILNPFRGYAHEERNVLDPALEETVKELSTIDGAFLVRGDGIIEAAGVFLKTSGQNEYEVPRGLGARHHAAAGITAVSNSVAVTVSASTGTVTVFRGGRIVTELEKPRTHP